MKHKLLLFVIIISIHFLPPKANAQAVDLTPPEQFSPVLQLLSAGDTKKAEKMLQNMRAEYGHTPDYYYVLGQVSAFKIEKAAKIRAPFLASNMRKNWEKALEIEPNHELTLVSLALFYSLAPSIIGGGSEKAQVLLHRLQHIGSPYQYSVQVVWLTSQEAKQEEITAAYLAWIDNEPQSISPRFNLAVYLIAEGAYQQGAEQLQHLDTLLQQTEPVPADEQVKVDYQWGKLAAESGDFLAQGRDRLLHLLTTETTPENISLGFAHVRLAKIFLHLNQPEQAAYHKAAAQTYAKDDKNLAGLINAL